MKLKLFVLGLSFVAFTLNAQDKAPKNWFHLDEKEDGYPGMSTKKAYRDLVKGKEGKTVVVAVIDSGVDAEHEDLADIMWTNPGEIAGNGIDDDHNGYIDDVHGWNFIGGKDGKNVNYENLEVVRLYNIYKKKYEGKSRDKLSKKKRAEYDKYMEYKKVIEEKIEKMGPNAELYEQTLGTFDAIAKAIGKKPEDITKADLDKFEPKEDAMKHVMGMLTQYMGQGMTFSELYNEIKGAADYYVSQVKYNYNVDFDARHIVGDNINDKKERNYGNNNVEGPDAAHGTHVSGIIAAIRGNNIGIDGVANNVRIMSVRTVPNGDERDKDVANAIRYAVDNGASIINMSFGKGASPYKKVVDNAVKYAAKHDVLLIHAAGNDGKENFMDNNYPNDRYMKKGLFKPRYCPTWIEVGALAPSADKDAPATFSNYSATYVDVFAPGVEIYSTIPDNKYASFQGTSMACPAVVGVAALVRSQYPKLTAKQVKEVLIKSVNKMSGLYNVPGEEGKTMPFNKLCVSGGTVNAYNALKMAATMKGKKK